MEILLEYLKDGNTFLNLLSAIIVIGAIIYGLDKVIKFVKEYLNDYYDKRHKNEDINDQINENEQNIINLTERIGQQDIKITELTNTVTNLCTLLDRDMQTIHRKEIRRYYEKAKAQNGQLSEKDMKDYYSALQCYNSHGGNSYVHDEIEPYMKTVDIIL